MNRTTTLFVLGFVLAGGACRSSQQQPETTAAGTILKSSAIAAFGLTPPDEPWAGMSFEDKEFYMIGKVNPVMKEIFERHDLEEYEGFDCVDCHGEEMEEIKFKMPAPSMYIVPPEGTPGHRGMLATFPETVKFMEETVTPAMGKLLGIENFTCAGCHPTAPPARSEAATRQRRTRKNKG